MGICFALGYILSRFPSQKFSCRFLLACTCALCAKEFKAMIAAISVLLGARCFAYTASLQACIQILSMQAFPSTNHLFGEVCVLVAGHCVTGR